MQMSLQELVLFILVLAIYFHETGSKLYEPKDRWNMPCHRNRNGALTNSATLQGLEGALNDMYALLNTSGVYKDECSYNITYNFTIYINETQKERATMPVNQSLATLMLGYELMIDRYSKGLWGYCSEEGAAELLQNITLVTEALKEYNTTHGKMVQVCDRAKLFTCHEDYERCTCISENRNFREVYGEYNLTTKKCHLMTGSDCPIAVHDNRTGQTIECNANEFCYIKDKKADNGLCTMKNFERYYGVNIEKSSLEHPDTPYRYDRADYPSHFCQCYKSTGKSENSPEDRGRWIHVFSAIMIQLVFNNL